MIIPRKAAERGHAHHGWLDSHHSFSFASYYDPAQMGISHLRVINDDRVAPSGGFPPHPHEDMEIISYVLDGALKHQDSMGNGSIIRAGEIQRMSAGSGISHSEYNASDQEPVHFLQIWIRPDHQGGEPGYAQEPIPEIYHEGFALLAGPKDSEATISIEQDARLLATRMSPNQSRHYNLTAGRCGYIHIARGNLEIEGVAYGAGDGARITAPQELHFATLNHEAEVLLFDLQEVRP